MKTLSDLKKNATSDQAVRMTDAERDLQRLQDEIRPFIRRRPLCEETSAGRWLESSALSLLEAWHHPHQLPFIHRPNKALENDSE